MKRQTLRALLLASCITSTVPGAAAEWVLPVSGGVRIEQVPDWGKEGFTLEVWAKPETADCGYATLMRGCFGFPKFSGPKDFDCYLVTPENKNAGARVYTPLEIGQYHYYVLTGDRQKAVAYRDGKALRTLKGPGVPRYDAAVPLHIGNSIGWAKNFQGAIGMVRLYNRALTPEEIRHHHQQLLTGKALPEGEGVILNEDRRELTPEAPPPETAVTPPEGGLELPGVAQAAPPDTAWHFPLKSGTVRVADVPDWGKKGFSLEVWAKPETADCGYAVLMRGAFGCPKFFGAKDFDCYLVTAENKNAGGRIYTPLEPGRYHYYVLTGDPAQSVVYRDGKAMRTGKGPGIPVHTPGLPLHIGNSIGWAKNFQGAIGMVRLHNRALTAAEVRSRYALLRNNLPLPADSSLILDRDRRTVGRYYRFEAKRQSVFPAAAGDQVSFTVIPESLTDSDLLRWGDLVLSCSRTGALTVRAGQDKFTVAKVFKAGESTKLAWARNRTANSAGCFVNGKFTGKLLRENAPEAPADMIFGGDFTGLIGRVELSENNLLPDGIGKIVTVKLDNRVVDQTCYPRSRHLAGKKEEFPAVIDFDDLTGWTMSYPEGAVTPRITRSKEEPLWGDFVLRTEFAQGEFPRPDAKVVLAPPAPIKIDKDFDTIAIWRFATRYGRPFPALSYSIQYRDSAGVTHSTGSMGGMLETGWGIHMRPLKQTVKAPAEIISITFSGFNEPRRVTYFDSLHVYQRSSAPLTDARVPSWRELGIPTRPETILPTAAEPGRVTLKRNGGTWCFESVTGSGKKLVYTITPATGTLSDITVSCNGKTFKPADGGGFCWALDNVYPVKNTSLLAPKSARVAAKLEKASDRDGKLTLEWLYTIDGKTDCRASWLLEVLDNTLIADLKAEPMVGEFHFGAVAGIAGKVVEIPFLNLGSWFRRSDPPGIFAGDGIFVSALVDWYNSDASGLFGQSSSTPGGRWFLNASTSDHRWAPDPGAEDLTDTVRDVSIINGGSYYWPKTDGRRNRARDRIMITVSDNLAAVLPNIPNPTHQYLQTTAEELWATRQWYTGTLPVPDYFDRELAMWQACRDYGMEKINVRLHGNINRMYTPRFNGDPATFIKSFCEPGIGGDRKLGEFFAGMKKLGMRIGIYTDHMLLSPLSDAWDRDKLNLDSNGCWLYSADNDKQTKISRMVALQKEYNALYRKMFAPNCAYLDQITCPPCWRYTDYDARAPEAAKFSAAFRVFAESLRVEEADFGPVLSEGKTQMAFAGLCDSYAQPQRADIHLLPDFNLRKLHLLSNDCGYELNYCVPRSDSRNAEAALYRLLAYEYAYGSTGHLFGIYYGAPYKEIPDTMIRSYFLIQPAQKYYALIPVKTVLYPVNGELAPVEAAIQAGTLRQNQVKIVYENGLEVGVNLNAEKDFTVTLNGKTYTLPPSGFAAYLPGKVEAYSARNRAGKRADLMKEGNFLFVANEPDQDEIKAEFDYTVRRLPDGTVELTPAPFKKAETVTLTVPFRNTTKVAGLNRDGKVLTEETVNVENGKVALAVNGKAFRYRVSGK